jgi:hypothetical protein
MPIICISATPVNKSWSGYNVAGMNAFLPKPFTEEMLLSTILSVIQDSPQESSEEQGVANKTSSTGTISLDNLYHIAGGDRQFVRQMLITFLDTTGSGLKEIHNAFLSGQWEKVADLAHKLLPPCRHIRATELSSLLSRIEKSVQDKDEIERVEDLIKESLRIFEEVREQLGRHIAEIS